MGCCGKIILAIFTILVGIAKIACACAIIAITAIHFQDLNIGLQDLGLEVQNPINVTATCTLGPMDTWGDGDLCYYVYAVAGISLAVELGLFILLCCTCNCCGLGFIFEFAFAVFGCLWWAAAGIVLSIKLEDARNSLLSPFQSVAGSSSLDDVANNVVSGADSLNDSLNDWRVVILALTWATCGLFGILVLIYLFKLFAKCCGCCLCCDDDDNKVSP